MNNNSHQVKGDRLHKLNPLIFTIIGKFQDTYYPQKQLCIDESIIRFKGRLSFKQYIPSKRHRFGVKLFVLCDSATSYI